MRKILDGSGRFAASSYVLIGMTVASSFVQAENAAPAENALDDIIVTATRRSESLANVPLSVAALSSEALQKAGVGNIADIAAATPGVEFDRSSAFGPALTNIAVRGVSSINGASTTGIYFGDTPLQSRVTTSSAVGNPYPIVFDAQRVEVLRGPQGTLFGAGAEGGAVRFIPTQPSFTELSAMWEGEAASTKSGAPTYGGGLAFGVPLRRDVAGLRASAYYRKDGGYIDRVSPFTGEVVDRDSNSSETLAGRVAMSFAAGESFVISPQVYFQRVSIHDTGSFSQYRSDPSNDRFVNARLVQQSNRDKFILASLTIEGDLPVGSLTAVSSYVHRDYIGRADYTNSYGASGYLPNYSDDGTYLGYGNPIGTAYANSASDAGPSFIPGKMDYYSQELRLASKDPDATITWVAGLFASKSKQREAYLGTSYVVYDGLANAFGMVESPEQAVVTDYVLRRYSQYANAENLVLASLPSNEEKQLAVFAQLDYRLTQRLTMTVGARFTRVDSDYRVRQSGLGWFDPSLQAELTASARESPFTPKVGLSFQADENNMYYVSAAKGFRTGAVNNPIPSICNFNEPTTVNADTLWSFEVGSKNRLFSDRLSVDASVYQINWRDIQTLTLIPACGFTPTLNAGKVRVRGFDLALRFQVTDGLRLDLAAAYTNAKYTKGIAIDGVPIVSDGDVVGSSFTSAQVPAPWHVTAAAEYRFKVTDMMSAYVRVQDSFVGRNDGPFANQNPQSAVYTVFSKENRSTNRVDIRIGLERQGDAQSTSVSLYVNNVTNSQPSLGQFYEVGGGPFLIGSNFLTGYTFRPRTIGLNVSQNF